MTTMAPKAPPRSTGDRQTWVAKSAATIRCGWQLISASVQLPLLYASYIRRAMDRASPKERRASARRLLLRHALVLRGRAPSPGNGCTAR